MHGLRLTLAITLAAALAACGGEGAGENSSDQANSAAPATPPETSLAAQPIKEEHKDLTMRPAWLAGRWQTDDGNCAASDAIMTLEPNGRYSFLQETGRWSLQGSSLTIEPEADPETGAPGEKSTVEVKALGPNEAETRRGDEAPARLFRCHDMPGANAPSAPRP